MWYMYDFIDKKDINRIEMLLIDEKGDKIHTIIYKKLVSSYGKTLQEDVIGKLHAISEIKNYNKDDGRSFRRKDIMIKEERNFSLIVDKIIFQYTNPDVDNFKDWYCLRLKIEDATGYLNVIAFENEVETLTKTPEKALYDLYNQDKDDSSQTTINSKVNQIDAIGSEEAPNYKLKKRKLRKIIYDDRDGKWTLALS
ncbi:hypothetical protein GIB67_002601 [Kingdonia uniflora]|uniref:Uncharacterized protein n=1 Tax=Kingdonia uniflora TaxID=39325 RepID=A0A7J7KXJ0_9MAGN|nr:hypothetical protein GIB67_002601 [Kingdonia uniflora]